MARRHEWDGEIDNLPPEALSYNIKEIPRPTLKEIANLLNAESVSAGNWESLAEKLGFTQNSVLDTLMQQARVQNTFPGLLMLQEWSRRAGSTAHVLLHALREIQREDAVRVLVDKLYDLHTMQLLVSIQEGEGSPRFLRVPTQKSAPLHASLDNTLHKPLYWYDIVGPSYNINWNTMSGQLQGTQLSLRLRVEPSEASISEIYGTTARLRHPPPNIPLDIPLGMNIPPEKHLPCSEGQGTMNDLSSSQLSHPGLSDKLSHTPPVFRFPPQPCGPLAQQQHSQDSALCGFEPMTSLGPPHSHFLQQFPNIDTLMSVSNLVLPGPPVSVSSLMDSAEDMQFDPSSCTELKEVLPPFSVGDHQDTLLKERVRSEQEKGNFASADQRKPLCEGDMNIRPMTPEEMAFVEGSQLTETSGPSTTASSLMHPVYVDHDRLIHFYNNPTSPQSLGSNCSSLSSTGTSRPQSPDCRPQLWCRTAAQHVP
ncbi:uncharacterized protein LOC143284888 [Babylonia areolata]|uniref:uncharacterized protein LOC143284888 n=1 Tax=Babylonia areolata TaxID=304850 RepID=UPI003FD0022D